MSRFSEIAEPVRGERCFQQDDAAATASQAAMLLGLSAQLAGDSRFVTDGPVRTVRQTDLEAEALADLRQMGVPEIAPSAQRVSSSMVKRELSAHTRRSLSAIQRLDRQAWTRQLEPLTGRMLQQPTPLSVMTVARTCLVHPEAMVRAAAALAWFRHGDDPRAALRVLRGALTDDDELVRELAAAALAQIAPADAALRRLLRARALRQSNDASHTATIVHGTWASADSWWQPGGDFHAYLLTHVRNDIYAAADRFEWTGGYSDVARAEGGQKLKKWIGDHELQGLDLLAHSHGGSVAMEATRLEGRIGELVLLSCPAHEAKYLPDFAMVSKVWHVRVHLDLVVLVDGGGFRFRHPQVTDVPLPLWFDHGASHEPDVWAKHGVAAKIGW